MKKISQELRYDGATIEQVNRMLADPAFRERVCDSQGVVRRTVQIRADEHGMSVQIDQHQEPRGIPGFARKFVGEEINIVQREDWSMPTKGNIHITIPGKPGELTGTAMLTEDPDGTTETVNLTVKVNIPLVGTKLEGVLADLFAKAMRVEHEVGVAWLAGQR